MQQMLEIAKSKKISQFLIQMKTIAKTDLITYVEVWIKGKTISTLIINQKASKIQCFAICKKLFMMGK